MYLMTPEIAEDAITVTKLDSEDTIDQTVKPKSLPAVSKSAKRLNVDTKNIYYSVNDN